MSISLGEENIFVRMTSCFCFVLLLFPSLSFFGSLFCMSASTLPFIPLLTHFLFWERLEGQNMFNFQELILFL